MWHPSFFASLQMELQDYYEHLKFIDEVNLNKLPRRIDAIVIVLIEPIHINKNIAAIFRRHNVFEYKSPDDKLSVNDYYNGLSYVFQYKSIDANKVSVDELSLSFVCYDKPQAVFDDLTSHGLSVSSKYPGIYYIRGERIPVQFIVSGELDQHENLFLVSLRKELDCDSFLKLLQCKKIVPMEIYFNYLNAVTMANKYMFWEVAKMQASVLDQIPDEKREEYVEMINFVIHNLGIDKKWEEKTEQERLAKEQERLAKEQALERERLAKEEVELLRKKIQELEMQSK